MEAVKKKKKAGNALQPIPTSVFEDVPTFVDQMAAFRVPPVNACSLAAASLEAKKHIDDRRSRRIKRNLGGDQAASVPFATNRLKGRDDMSDLICGS